MKYEKDI